MYFRGLAFGPSLRSQRGAERPDARAHAERGHEFKRPARLVAVISLDLVIAIDSGQAHLAGALGRPVWTLVCTSPDFRWLMNREDSPWYPTMRPFRQTQAGQWRPVFERVAEKLRTRVL
jgi:hypothetical protein